MVNRITNVEITEYRPMSKADDETVGIAFCRVNGVLVQPILVRATEDELYILDDAFHLVSDGVYLDFGSIFPGKPFSELSSSVQHRLKILVRERAYKSLNHGDR